MCVCVCKREHYAMWRWRFSRAVWKKRTETVAVDQFRFVQLSKVSCCFIVSVNIS